MDRRRFLSVAAAGIPSTWLWIPKLAIAQIKGDPREAIIKARTTISSNWGLISQGSSTLVKKTSPYYGAVTAATNRMKSKDYIDFTSAGTELASTDRQALFGAFHANTSDFCIHFFAQDRATPLAYVSTIPFLMAARVLEDMKRTAPSRSSIAWLYPTEPVQIFEAYLGQSPRVPVRVGCAEAMWVCTYSVAGARAGNGTFGIWSRDANVRQPLYSKHLEWSFT
jgi:hypothetical protein